MAGLGLLWADDLTHSLGEGQAQDFDKEIDGVAGQVSLWPAPVGVFDDQPRKGGQGEIARLALDDLKAPLLQQRGQRRDSGRPDLVARPAGPVRGVGWQYWQLWGSWIGQQRTDLWRRDAGW